MSEIKESTGDNLFPPASWLGNALNMLAVTPIDIKCVEQGVKAPPYPIINLNYTTTSSQTVGDQTWTVPKNVLVSSGDVTGGETSYNYYASGSSAASALQADASLAAKYMAVEINASTSYSIDKNMKSDTQYSFFSFNQSMAEVKLQGYGPDIQIDNLKYAVPSTLVPLDPKVKATQDAWASFFDTYGSHVIVGVSYGSRMQLTVWASNSDQTTDEQYAANLEAEYSGLTDGGSFDASIKGSTQLNNWETNSARVTSCRGGDPTLAVVLDDNPQASDAYNALLKWAATATSGTAGVMAYQTLPIWEILSVAHDPYVQSRAEDTQNAYQWLANNPQTHQTQCRFTVDSDWGEIALLSPATKIVNAVLVDTTLPNDGITASDSKITWGKEHSYNFHRAVTVDFIIENDGSPIDFEMSHGRDGASSSTGQCNVQMLAEHYVNNTIVGDGNWNTQTYYQKPVNATPVSPSPSA